MFHICLFVLDNHHILPTFLVIWPVELFQFRLYYTFHSSVFWGLGDLANTIVPVQIVLHITLPGILRSWWSGQWNCSSSDCITHSTPGYFKVMQHSKHDFWSTHHSWRFHCRQPCWLSPVHQMILAADWHSPHPLSRCYGWAVPRELTAPGSGQMTEPQCGLKAKKGMLLKLLLSINQSKLLRNDFQSN